jgi:hypothetical protein
MQWFCHAFFRYSLINVGQQLLNKAKYCFHNGCICVYQAALSYFILVSFSILEMHDNPAYILFFSSGSNDGINDQNL